MPAPFYFPCITAQAATSPLISFYPQTRIYIMGSPGSRALELRLNHTTGFPGLQTDHGTTQPA